MCGRERHSSRCNDITLHGGGGGLFGLISYTTPKKNVSICKDLIKKKKLNRNCIFDPRRRRSVTLVTIIAKLELISCALVRDIYYNLIAWDRSLNTTTIVILYYNGVRPTGHRAASPFVYRTIYEIAAEWLQYYNTVTILYAYLTQRWWLYAEHAASSLLM